MEQHLCFCNQEELAASIQRHVMDAVSEREIELLNDFCKEKELIDLKHEKDLKLSREVNVGWVLLGC